MTDDLISRQAAIEILWEEPSYSDPINVLTEARDRIKSLPSAERHGHWRILYEANPYDLEAECSVCHNEVKMPTCMGKPIYSYCPHCAAKMDEVAK